MPKLDPTKMKDWQIAEAAEENMKPLYQLARDLGLAYGELLPMGEQLAKVDYKKARQPRPSDWCRDWANSAKGSAAVFASPAAARLLTSKVLPPAVA
jgi:hypothetical protein